MFHNQLPKRWCIERNPRNFEEVNRLFGKMNGKTYKADGTWRTAGGVFKNHDYLCFPAYEDKKYQAKRKPSGYTEINLEQLKNYIMSKESKKIMDKLPENWYVVVTDSMLEDACQWRFNKSLGEFNNPEFTVGVIVGMYRRWDNNCSREWMRASERLESEWGQEISEEDFRFHVLKKYTREDWIEGRIALLKPDVKDPLLNTFLKECNPKNTMLSGGEISKSKYLVANMDKRVIEDHGKGFWKPFTTTDLPIVEDVKKLYANENIMKNSKVIEYRVKEKFKKVSESLYNQFKKDPYGGYGRFDYKSVLREQYENAGVLDIWFDEIEYVPKLPKINGYEGEDLGESIRYGCAVLEKVWFTTSNNRHIKELTLSSNVKINELQMKEIRNYLQSVTK